jgi:hypothetical protein
VVIGIVIMGAGIITIAGTGIIGGIVTIGTGITGTGTTGTTATGKAANWQRPWALPARNICLRQLLCRVAAKLEEGKYQ